MARQTPMLEPNVGVNEKGGVGTLPLPGAQTQEGSQQGELATQPPPTTHEDENALPLLIEGPWNAVYESCPRWGNPWKAAGDPNVRQWSQGFRRVKDRLYFNRTMCIPKVFQNVLVRKHHALWGHVAHDQM